MATISNFAVTPLELPEGGGEITVTWSLAGDAYGDLHLDGSSQTISGTSGSITFSITDTTTLALICDDARSESATVTVAAAQVLLPSVTALIQITPDDGTAQNPSSYQVSSDATLVLSWNALNADHVDVSGVGDGRPPVGSAPIPTSEATYTLVAVSPDGIKSVPISIDVLTHDPGTVVSGHVDLGSGMSTLLSFVAKSGDDVVTHAKIGDKITLVAIVSDASETLRIAGQDAALAEIDGGHLQASLDVVINAATTGDFDCEVTKDGAIADKGRVHLDIEAGPGASAGSDSGEDAANATGDASSDGGNATGDSAGDRSGDATGAGSGDGAGDATGAGSGEGSGDGVLQNAAWGADVYSHGQAIQLSVDAVGVADGRTVYFAIETADAAGNWTSLQEVQGTVSGGKASATATLNDPDEGSGSGAPDSDGDGSGAGESAHTCSFRFHASFSSSAAPSSDSGSGSGS